MSAFFLGKRLFDAIFELARSRDDAKSRRRGCRGGGIFWANRAVIGPPNFPPVLSKNMLTEDCDRGKIGWVKCVGEGARGGGYKGGGRGRASVYLCILMGGQISSNDISAVGTCDIPSFPTLYGIKACGGLWNCGDTPDFYTCGKEQLTIDEVEDFANWYTGGAACDVASDISRCCGVSQLLSIDFAVCAASPNGGTPTRTECEYAAAGGVALEWCEEDTSRSRDSGVGPGALGAIVATPVLLLTAAGGVALGG